jgi:hypothetical protein
MKRLLAAGALFFAMVLPAQATEWMDCSGGEKVNIRVLLSAMDVIAVDTVEIEVADRKWSTRGGEGVTLITKGQAFETPDQIWIDVTDENVNLIVARLRVFKAFEDGSDAVEPSDAKGGTLHMPGIGAWAVSCSGP